MSKPGSGSGMSVAGNGSGEFERSGAFGECGSRAAVKRSELGSVFEALPEPENSSETVRPE